MSRYTMKYVIMEHDGDSATIPCDDNRTIREFKSQGYKITNRIKAIHPLKMNICHIIKKNGGYNK